MKPGLHINIDEIQNISKSFDKKKPKKVVKDLDQESDYGDMSETMEMISSNDDSDNSRSNENDEFSLDGDSDPDDNEFSSEQEEETKNVYEERALPKTNIPEKDTIETMFAKLDPKKIIKYFNDNKLYPTKEHLFMLLSALDQNIKKYRSTCYQHVDALITAGYYMTHEDHIMLFEKYNVVTDSLFKELTTLMRKHILRDEEQKTLSKLAYLMVVCDDDKQTDIAYQKLIGNNKKYYYEITSEIPMVKLINGFRQGLTVNQLLKTIPNDTFTLDMMNVVMACISKISSPKRIRDYIDLFREQDIYPDFHTFRVLRQRSYKRERNINHTEFISNRHKQINEYIFETYSR